MDVSDVELIRRAREVARPRRLSSLAEAGGVGCALVTKQLGRVYVGVCIEMECGVGFCAEHSAIAAMVSAGEDSQIASIVAVDCDGVVLPPCGRCRECIFQAHDSNSGTRVFMPGNRVMLLSELLPHPWFTAPKEKDALAVTVPVEAGAASTTSSSSPVMVQEATVGVVVPESQPGALSCEGDEAKGKVGAVDGGEGGK